MFTLIAKRLKKGYIFNQFFLFCNANIQIFNLKTHFPCRKHRDKQKMFCTIFSSEASFSSYNEKFEQKQAIFRDFFKLVQFKNISHGFWLDAPRYSYYVCYLGPI